MDTISIAINLFTLLAIVTGIYFGVAEIRRGAQVRRDEAAVNILTSKLFSENIPFVLTIFDLPADAPAELIEQDQQFELHVMQVSSQIEAWGFLVFQRNIDLHTFDYMVGGMTRSLWNRMHNYIFSLREKHNDPSLGEWFQWLVERMEESPAPQKGEGAYAAFSDWKP